MTGILNTQLPITVTPIQEGAGIGIESLDANQRSAKIGDAIPIVFGKRVGDSGGVLVSPPATECRFEVYNDVIEGETVQHVRVYYELVLSEGQIDRLQVRDIFQQSCRVGTATTTYGTRSGDWVPGNFLPDGIEATRFCGTGGTYRDITTLSFINGIPAYSDQWRRQVHCFVRGGINLTRLLDDVNGSSNNYADLALYLLRQSSRLDDESIDLPSYGFAARYVDINAFRCDTTVNLPQNMPQWLRDTAPLFLLRRVRIGGKEGLRPLLPANTDGSINTGFIKWKHAFTNDQIIDFSLEYTSLTDRKPFAALMMWRQQPDDGIGLVRITEVRYGGVADAGPYEQHDLSAYVTNENHAVKVGAYILARRRYVQHSLTVTLTPDVFDGSLVLGDIIRITYTSLDNNGDTFEHDFLYELNKIGRSLTGLIELELIHFPIDDQGRSLISLDVVRAQGSGLLLATGREAVSCDFNSPDDLSFWPDFPTPDWDLNFDFDFDIGFDVPIGDDYTFDLDTGAWDPAPPTFPAFPTTPLTGLYPDGIDIITVLPDQELWDAETVEVPTVSIEDLEVRYQYNTYYLYYDPYYAFATGFAVVSQPPDGNFELIVNFGDERFSIVIPSAIDFYGEIQPGPYSVPFALRTSLPTPFYCNTQQLVATGWSGGGFSDVELPASQPVTICPYVATITANNVVVSTSEPYTVSGAFDVDNLPIGDNLEIALALGDPFYKYDIRDRRWIWTGSGSIPQEPQIYMVEILGVQSRITDDWVWDAIAKAWQWRRFELPVEGSPPANLPEPTPVSFSYAAPNNYAPGEDQLFIAYIRQGGFTTHVPPALPGVLSEVTVVATLLPPLEVDGETALIDLEIAGLTGIVTKVEITINFTKMGETEGFTYNNEIGFALIHPDGLVFANIVNTGFFNGEDNTEASATMTFADEYSPYAASGLVSGSYQPADLFSIFNGETANGTWQLEVTDDYPIDPLKINSVSLTVFI